MSDCSSFDPLVTPYVDGELAGVDREALERHMHLCPPCYSRVAAERAVREMFQARRASLKTDCAPERLRATCLAHRGRDWARAIPGVSPAQANAASWRRRAAPLAAAAAVVLVAGGMLGSEATRRSSRLMAAELAADHVKCFTVNGLLGTHHSASTVEESMASDFGWDVHLPPDAEREGLELVGSRLCLYGQGKVAHIMYRHNGEPVSLYMLPKAARRDEVVRALGHECVIWAGRDRTFVLVSNETRGQVERLAAFAQAQFH
jgi:anti-sigma factor RsiW